MFSNSVVIGYIYASLKFFNEVDYAGIAKFPLQAIILMVVFSIGIYTVVTLIIRTKARAFVKKVFKVFEAEKQFDPVHICCGVCVFLTLYGPMLKVPCDYRTHTNYAVNIFDWISLKKSLLDLPYPLWHIFVNLLNKVLYIPGVYAAALTSATFYTAEYCIARKIILEFNKGIPAEKIKYIDILAASFMFLQPIYMPWFNENQYLGQGTPNIWHNPTIVCCYPFVLICTILFVRMFKKFQNDQKIYVSDYVQMGLFLFLSISAKPAFFQFFIPAVAILFIITLIKTKGKSLNFSVKFVISCIPAGLYCIIVYILSFVEEDTSKGNGVGVEFLKVWKLYSPNIFVSLILVLAFPIAYIIFQNKHIGNKFQLEFAGLCVFCALLEYSFLYETGSRMTHGNFSWGVPAAYALLFCFTAADWVKPLFEKKKAMMIPLIIYMLHLLFGFRYYIELFQQRIKY